MLWTKTHIGFIKRGMVSSTKEVMGPFCSVLPSPELKYWSVWGPTMWSIQRYWCVSSSGDQDEERNSGMGNSWGAGGSCWEVEWHHWCNEHEFGQTPRDGEGQGGLVCCSPWGHKESDTTEQLNWTDRNLKSFFPSFEGAKTNLLIFNWQITVLQYCVDFCYTSTWVSHRYTYIPSLMNLPPISHPVPPL